MCIGLTDSSSVQPLPEVAHDGPDDITAEDPRVSEALVAGNLGPSRPPPARRTIARHGTEIAYGLVTPGVTPAKAPGNQARFHITSSSHSTYFFMLSQLTSTAGEQDVGMDNAATDDHDSSVLSPGPGFDFPAPRAGQPQPSVVAVLEDRISVLMGEKEALLQKEEYVLRKLSRNGQGTVSNIEAVTDRAVQQRDQLRAENQELRTVIERLKSRITDLQGEIARVQEKLERAKVERIEIAQSRRRWIARMWSLAGRLPGELRKKDAEIDNVREKLVEMYARLAQEQSVLREAQGQLSDERDSRAGLETELKDTKAAHARAILERDLAGQRLKDQLKLVINSLESGAMSI